MDPHANSALREADDGLQAHLALERKGLQPDESTNQQIRRRADMIVMPLICMLYGAQFLDRTSLSYASVTGLIEDLSLVGDQYSWLGSVFFFSYLGAEIATGRLLQRFPVAKYLSICGILWGIVLACFATVHSYSTLLALRCLLGLLQACVSPALILIVAQWYTKSEQVTRTAVWVSSNCFAQLFGGLVAYGLAPFTWRTIVLTFGCMTIVIGVLAAVFLPDSPLNAWWLSHDQRHLAVERIRVNQQGIGNRTFKTYQLREVFTDPFVWCIFVFSIAANIPNGGLTNFFSLLIKSFGYPPRQALLLSTPGGAVGLLVVLAWGMIARRLNGRLICGIACLTLAMLGVILMVVLPPQGRLAGYYLTAAVPAGEASILSLISSNVAGHTKKTTVAAIFFVGYCVGNIIGPQTFRAVDAPDYRPAKIAITASLAICILTMMAMYGLLRRRNYQRQHWTEPSHEVVHGSGFWDLTDRENPGFEYAL